MIPDVAVPSYQSAYGSLGSVYDPQVGQVNSEIAQLQPQQDAQQAGLDQAKVNAFRDITSAANSKGMLFSGFSPDQQAQYVGNKYLPAVANLKTSFQNSRNTLLEKINQINAQRSTQAQGIVSSATTASQNAAYKNAQLMLSAQRNANSGGISPSLAYSMQKDTQNAGNNFLTYIQNQFKRAGGQGNTNITRNNQDAWANSWFAQHGVNDPKAKQMYWDLFNTTYNRAVNPLNDPRYKR